MGDQNSNRVDYTTMKTFQILAILACVAGLNAGSIVGKPIVGKCPPVITTKPDFDYKQYAGIWYEIERVPVIFESGMSCVQATYNEIGAGVISVKNTAVLATGGFTNITRTATAPYPDQPGYLMVKFPSRPAAGYRVLDTDYTTWASVYECVKLDLSNSNTAGCWPVPIL